MGDIEKFCTSFSPLLKQNHEFLASLAVDGFKSFVASRASKAPIIDQRRRKTGKTMFGPVLEELGSVTSKSGQILTKHFLESCMKSLPVLVNYGLALSYVEQDIYLCAAMLQYRYSLNPSKFNYLYSLVQFEIETDAVNRPCSDTFSLYRLTRNMDFVVELFRNLVEHPDWITFDACNDSYGKTLKPWLEGQKWFDPGNIVEAQFARDREEFMEMIGGDGDVMGDMKNFYSVHTPLLEKTSKFLFKNLTTTPNSEIVLHHELSFAFIHLLFGSSRISFQHHSYAQPRNNFVNGEMFRKTLSGRCVRRPASFEAFQVLSVLELTLLRCPHRQ